MPGNDPVPPRRAAHMPPVPPTVTITPIDKLSRPEQVRAAAIATAAIRYAGARPADERLFELARAIERYITGEAPAHGT